MDITYEDAFAALGDGVDQADGDSVTTILVRLRRTDPSQLTHEDLAVLLRAAEERGYQRAKREPVRVGRLKIGM